MKMYALFIILVRLEITTT